MGDGGLDDADPAGEDLPFGVLGPGGGRVAFCGRKGRDVVDVDLGGCDV